MPVTRGSPRSRTRRSRWSPTLRTCSSSPSDSMVSRTASPAAQDSGLPPKVEPCCPAASSAVTSGPKVTRAPIGTPPPSPLARVIASGTTPACWQANHVAGAADPGLDLVDDEERAGLGGQLARRPEVLRVGGDDPALALDRLEDDGGGVRPHRGLEGVDVAPRHVHDTGEERLERLAVGGLVGQREGAGGPSVEGALGGDDAGAPGAAGELDGRLDGLGAAVAEEDRRALGRARRPAGSARRARPGAPTCRSSRRGRAARPASRRRRRGRGGCARAR